MSKKKKPPTFSKTLMYINNNEKSNHEKWSDIHGRDMLNFPKPYRIILAGGVNSSKTSTVLNIIARAFPVFENIYLLHCGGKYTTEYDAIDYTLLDSIPSPDDERFNGKKKHLLIIEDKCFEDISKTEKKNLNRLFGYVSTHKNTSIIMTAQNFFDIPPSIRRMSNIFILWKILDRDLLGVLGRRVGYCKNDMIALANDYFVHYRDSLWFDNTQDSPYPIRSNGYTEIPPLKQCKKKKKTVEEK